MKPAECTCSTSPRAEWCPWCIVRIGFAKAIITSNPAASRQDQWAVRVLQQADQMMAELAK
jgi:hypothetical protein